MAGAPATASTVLCRLPGESPHHEDNGQGLPAVSMDMFVPVSLDLPKSSGGPLRAWGEGELLGTDCSFVSAGDPPREPATPLLGHSKSLGQFLP